MILETLETFEISLRSPLVLARRSLSDACAALDEAVRAMAEAGGQTVMANAEVLALLLRVVTARRHLGALERPAPVPPVVAAVTPALPFVRPMPSL